MKKLNLCLQKYLVYGLPFVVALVIWESFQSQTQIQEFKSPFLHVIYKVGTLNAVLWFVSLTLFVILLVFRKDTQEQSIKFLAGMKERDEREELITAIAARTSFVATACFLIILFFISCFSLTIAQNPDFTFDNHQSKLMFGFNFIATDSEDKFVHQPAEHKLIIEHKGIPLSKSAIILLVLTWQIASFRWKVRKMLADGRDS